MAPAPSRRFRHMSDSPRPRPGRFAPLFVLLLLALACGGTKEVHVVYVTAPEASAPNGGVSAESLAPSSEARAGSNTAMATSSRGACSSRVARCPARTSSGAKVAWWRPSSVLSHARTPTVASCTAGSTRDCARRRAAWSARPATPSSRCGRSRSASASSRRTLVTVCLPPPLRRGRASALPRDLRLLRRAPALTVRRSDGVSGPRVVAHAR